MCLFSRKHIECSMCRFATSCSIAYANHMMGFHSGQMTSLNLNIPWERPMKEPMHCLCGFASRYGNKIGRFVGNKVGQITRNRSVVLKKVVKYLYLM